MTDILNINQTIVLPKNDKFYGMEVKRDFRYKYPPVYTFKKEGLVLLIVVYESLETPEAIFLIKYKSLNVNNIDRFLSKYPEYANLEILKPIY